MTIEIISGNLLDGFDRGEVNNIGHCCNMQNTFGSGIAKSIKERYPKAYEADTIWYKSGDKHIPLSMAALPYNIEREVSPRIFNLYGQEFYGTEKRQLNYGRLAKSLIAMQGWLNGNSTVGFPYKMGSDRAGGDWEIVLEMIEFIFKYHDVKIYKL